MNLFRSRFFAIVVALLISAGYGAALSGPCDDDRGAGFGKGCEESGGHACLCLCHEAFVDEQAPAPTPVGCAPVSVLCFAITLEIPPDAVPVGIEHPPQLA